MEAMVRRAELRFAVNRRRRVDSTVTNLEAVRVGSKRGRFMSL